MWAKDGSAAAINVQPGESIQEAIDAAPEGAVICLAEGEWQENIVIGKSLTLRGEGADRSAIQVKPEEEPVGWQLPEFSKPEDGDNTVIVIENRHPKCVVMIRAPSQGEEINVVIENVAVTGAFEWPNHDLFHPATQIGMCVAGSAQVTIADSTIQGNQPGIMIAGSAQVTIAGSIITGNEPAMKVSGSAHVSITDSIIKGNNLAGITISTYVKATITDSVIEGNGEKGVDIRGFARVNITRSTIKDHYCCGIKMLYCAYATINNSTIENSIFREYDDDIDIYDRCGIQMGGLGGSSRATITDSTIKGSEIGIEMKDATQVTMTGSTIEGAAWSGVSVEDTAQLIVTKSIIEGNGDGIRVYSCAQATIKNNLIRNSRGSGIDSTSDEPIHGCENRMWGNGVDLSGNLSSELRKPLIPETQGTQLSFPGPYDTLQETIDALAPGGTITVAHGMHQGGLTLWKPLTLAGQDTGAVIKGAVSLIDKAQGVTISGLTIQGSFTSGLRLSGQTQAIIINSTIKDNRGDGIKVEDSAQASIDNLTIESNSIYGICVTDVAQVAVSESTIQDHFAFGICMRGSAQATITGSTIAGHKSSICMGGSACASIRDNEMFGNKRYSVLLDEPPCSYSFPRTPFTGYVTGSGNTIRGPDDPDGNEKGAVCPDDLDFLMTEEGGELDWRE